MLRPQQRQELLSDQKMLQNKLKNPFIQDKGAVSTQLRRLNTQIETQSPKPFASDEVDKAVRREAQLKDDILIGMPSQEEMRKSPPGAIGKHMAWEKRNKQKIKEWKDLRLRLNSGTDDPDIANLEQFRPVSNTLNMHNAHIPGKQYFLPSDEYKEGFDNIEFGKDVEVEKTTPAIEAKINKTKGKWSPERKARHSAAIKAKAAEKRALKEKGEL